MTVIWNESGVDECIGDLSLIERAVKCQVHPICPTSRFYGQVDFNRPVECKSICSFFRSMTNDSFFRLSLTFQNDTAIERLCRTRVVPVQFRELLNLRS